MEFVFRDGRMLGAILIGRPDLAAHAKKAIESGMDFSMLINANPCIVEVIDHTR